MRVIKRNGSIAEFDGDKIKQAIVKAFMAVEGEHAKESERVDSATERMTAAVTHNLGDTSHPIHIETIQDMVESSLMTSGHHKVARAYVLYREKRASERNESVSVTDDIAAINRDISAIRVGDATGAKVIGLAKREMFDGVSIDEYYTGLILAAKPLIETDPDYSFVCARILLEQLKHQTGKLLFGKPEWLTIGRFFNGGIQRGLSLGLLDPAVVRLYDLDKLSAELDARRDSQFTYFGLRTLYDRYFLRHNKGKQSIPFELPQGFFMRVAMGLASKEDDPNARAIEFYNLMSAFDFMPSTPTLFNSCTKHPQLSSCYLTTIGDSIADIFEAYKDNARLSKFAGGLGNDWTRVRGHGAYISDTNGHSKGVVPFLKVANDTAVAVNQGGKRKGAVCSYLETWHRDIESYLDMRKNTGDDRMRTHDMNTANWIPDLFMERMMAGEHWTLFSPDETPDLHDLYGNEFKARYIHYERQSELGRMNSKRVQAKDLWRKMLSMVYETGHPWMCFKDPCNIRNPQKHCGVVHSSNLCTEITLNTSDDEIAVCNLGSINLAQHVDGEKRDLLYTKIKRTVNIAVRMLDNVIDYNYYPVDKAERSNKRHRPIGLGIMGFQDALYKLRLPYADAKGFADQSMEQISYAAIKASCLLAKERGKYESYEGSAWDNGYLPVDTHKQLRKYRVANWLGADLGHMSKWGDLTDLIQQHGMRNSNVLAIAPTATIANICGVTQSIEPTYQNLFVKSNLSGEFTVVNPYLVRDLKRLKLWDTAMVNDLKYADGSVKRIARIPDKLKALYTTAFETDQFALIDCAARRQKWIDQSQSLNLYLAEPSGKKLNEIYIYAWMRGLKTTYYLRSLGATHAEKSTAHTGALNAVSCEVCE